MKTKVWAGVDWGHERHQVAVIGENGDVEQKSFAHEATAVREMCEWLTDRGAGDASAVAVAIETPRGPLVDGMLERGLVVYAINPKQLDRFRDRFTAAGAKDDRRDAEVLARSLRTDADAFRRLRPDRAWTNELRGLTRLRDEVVEDRQRLCERLREQLWRYYPQMLELIGDDLSSRFALGLLELAPTPSAAARLRPAAVRALLSRSRVRRVSAEDVVATLRKEPLRLTPGTVEAASGHAMSVVVRLRPVVAEERRLDARIEEMLAQGPPPQEAGDEENVPGKRCEQRDVEILRTLPGVGRIVAAVLLAEASQPLAERDYTTLRALAGVAPVTRQSGKTRVVSMRRACNARLRDAVFHWASTAAHCDERTRARYASLRAHGKPHALALRIVGDGLLRTACAMLSAGMEYDSAHVRAA